MKLLRYGPSGSESPGILDQDQRIRDLSGEISDIDRFCVGSQEFASLGELDVSQLPLVTAKQRIGPPLGKVGKVVCIGLNYRLHAQEASLKIPAEPIIFMKAPTSVTGPDDSLIIPKDSVKTDWETELAVVIGKTARYIDEQDALNYVAGYCIANDVSEREFQTEGTGQWVKGKSADSFCPLGPYLVTPDEVPDPQNLRLWLEVNHHRYQDGNTDDMIFGVAHLISYVSRFMTLLPGDLLLTGTPSGVGFAMNPPIFLKPGDQVKLGIDGLGVQTQHVVAYDENARLQHYYI